ncbi:helix-turn-helix domain-containing protein [Paenibacillus flagellatus]|uniref:AraC family transcriptional regulator n=1 Tax=Paenibacillus flagellatus TaxID=2211139 RepID=A0A2V5KBV1_9BACL|nr:helix-turn-helix domain-containing protein [Paenibacillus flagellatus]PYI56938.1 AraC family transcriptional regulator [Paenibacillus flagellatus]
MLRKTNRRKSIFLTILVSYIAILLFPVAAGIYLYHRVEHIMVGSANRTNLGLLEQIMLVADERFKELDRMSLQLAFNPKLQWSLSHIESDYVKNEFDLADIMKDFRNVNKVSSFIYDFMVYFKNTDTILTTSGKSDSPFFFSKILVFNDKPADWVQNKMLTGSHLKTYFPVTTIKEGERVSNVIPYVQSLPLGEEANPKGYLVVLIHEQEFDRLFKPFKKVNSSSISIIDDRRQVIISTSSEYTLSPDVLAEMENESGYYTFEQNNEAMMLSYTTGQNGWKYVSVVPMHVVLKQVVAVKEMAVMLLFLIVVAGIIASYVMAYRNYSPIRDVVRTIMLDNTHAREDSANEFDYIKQSITRSLGEKDQMRQTLKKHAPVVQANFLSRLIKGYIDVSALSDDSLIFMGIRFEYDYFGVMLLEIEDCRDFIKEDTEQEWAHVRFILSDLSRDLLGKPGYIVEMDRGRLAVLLNVGTPAEPAYLDAAAFIEKLQMVAVHRFKLKYSIAVSQFHRGLEDIGRCYREALIALDYRMIRGSNAVIYHREIAGLEPHFYHYQLEDEVQLMNFAKSGDYASVERRLDQIYEANFLSNALSPEMGKFLFIDLLSTIVKVMNGLQISDKKRLEGSIDPAKIIAECATAEEMIHKTKDMYRVICQFTREEKTEHGERLYVKICQYIDEHYSDNGLSLSSMADHFHISLQYLSTFFKKHSGENITDYLAAVRVREAKKLLADPTITIGDIALKIGYANAVSFVRFFKKVEGVPPGKYREMLNR